ncbi:hypothetical protein GSI_03433 [Ganoderma sinense ZZ0214-1]|uniref:FAD/NAD(P)-binding domain-containing protein n=1 Tax=Ganoderma sinense ZZ0214-1 TaxID=1077348 RepID=A0A2G8SLL2_9APHY|nr:hypothetical protein GSI_03433 [Ganoderma sinense ZZ0214-1]
MAFNPHLVATEWLAQFSSALREADARAFVDFLLPNGWLRDILVFTWDIRALEGRDKVLAYLTKDRFAAARITDVRLDETPDLAPRTCKVPVSRVPGVEFAFAFECHRGHGRAHVRLGPDVDDVHRASTVFTELVDLPGHEELTALPPRDETADANPHVIIVGAAQTGLQVAARFKRMNIPTLVIDRNARVGDNWRERYPTLILNTTRRHHTFLYQPYPSGWPEFTPRDKVADWLEHYASSQELTIWTNSELKTRPAYNKADRRWDVTVVRDGVEVQLRPAHIVLATGSLGRPIVPDFPGAEEFKGRVMHSSKFPGGALFSGQHTVVVGAGNSSIDVCVDLAEHDAASVTMVQRSTSCVMTREFVADQLRAVFRDDVPLDVVDFRFSSISLGLYKKMAIEHQDAAWEAHKELHEKLRKAGVSCDLGPEGEGVSPFAMEKGGGYWMDKGGASLIADGTIKVKSLVSIERFTKNGLLLSDGTELPADLVVFATGYSYIRETNVELLGEDVINQTEEVFGLDDEGEIEGSYRPCGYPGLWFATGDFANSRCLSKALALQIKAIELGAMPYTGRRQVQVGLEHRL